MSYRWNLLGMAQPNRNDTCTYKYKCRAVWRLISPFAMDIQFILLCENEQYNNQTTNEESDDTPMSS